MSTTAPTHTDATASAAPSPQVRGISFATLLRVETRKLVDTLSGRWLLIVMAAITAIAVVAMWFTGEESQLYFENFLGATATPLMMLLPVLGILAATSEWSQRTGLTTYTLEPRRIRVLLAKLGGALILGLASAVLAITLAAAITWLAALVKNPTDPWKITGLVIAGFVLALLLSLAQGVAVGTIIPNTPAAIVVFFLIPMGWMFLMQWERMRSIRPWADLNAATAPLFEGSVSGQQWAQLGVASLIWVVLPLAIGAVILRRREVK